MKMYNNNPATDESFLVDKQNSVADRSSHDQLNMQADNLLLNTHSNQQPSDNHQTKSSFRSKMADLKDKFTQLRSLETNSLNSLPHNTSSSNFNQIQKLL